jgi:hypothetical protein
MTEPVHTRFAMAALDLASVFNSVVGVEPVSSTEGASFKVELSAPDGPSTGGGAQSLQHIRLVRPDLTIVAGSIDPVQNSAELRSHAFADSLHAQRYKGSALPIDRAAYEALLGRVRKFAAAQGYAVVLKEAAPTPVQARPAQGGARMIAVAVAIALVVAGAAYVLLMHR